MILPILRRDGFPICCSPVTAEWGFFVFSGFILADTYLNENSTGRILASSGYSISLEFNQSTCFRLVGWFGRKPEFLSVSGSLDFKKLQIRLLAGPFQHAYPLP